MYSNILGIEKNRICWAGNSSEPDTSTVSHLLCNSLLKELAAPHFKKVQDLAGRYAGKVSWFQEIMTQVPKS
jgi:hypothetical protein